MLRFIVIALSLMLGACASSREVRISGTCKGPDGQARAGILIKQMEVGRRLPIGAMLPAMTAKSVAKSDENGSFTLVVRYRKAVATSGRRTIGKRGCRRNWQFSCPRSGVGAFTDITFASHREGWNYPSLGRLHTYLERIVT
jgi:hypothetical protein